MILIVDFKKNFITDNLAKQQKIPCHVQIGETFNVNFSVAYPLTVGTVIEWDRKLFEERTQARGGGKFVYDEPALITLREIGENNYKVDDLLFFYNDFGWCPIIENGEYATPYPFWDNNDDDPDYQG